MGPYRKHKWLCINFTCFGADEKVTTGGMEKHKQDNPKKGNCFACGGHRLLLSLHLILLILLLFAFASVLVTAGSTGSPAPLGWHIHICGDKKVCCVSKLSLRNMEEIPGDLPLHRDSWTIEGQPSNRTGIWFFVHGGTGGALPEPCMLTPWGWHDGPTSSSGTCAHSPAPCSLTGIHKRTPELTGPSLAPCSLHRWEQSSGDRCKESGDAGHSQRCPDCTHFDFTEVIYSSSDQDYDSRMTEYFQISFSELRIYWDQTRSNCWKIYQDCFGEYNFTAV